MDNSPTTLLTARDVGRILNLRLSTIYAAAARNQIPCVRLWRGKRRTLMRFDPTDIAAFIRARRTKTEAVAGLV